MKHYWLVLTIVFSATIATATSAECAWHAWVLWVKTEETTSGKNYPQQTVSWKIASAYPNYPMCYAAKWIKAKQAVQPGERLFQDEFGNPMTGYVTQYPVIAAGWHIYHCLPEITDPRQR
jgi:hypothetical protein